MAFQQLSTVTVQPDTRYTGPYLSGDDIEVLEKEEALLDASWKQLAEDLESGNGD